MIPEAAGAGVEAAVRQRQAMRAADHMGAVSTAVKHMGKVAGSVGLVLGAGLQDTTAGAVEPCHLGYLERRFPF